MAINAYHATRHRLPESLDVLLEMPSGLASETVRDPVTARPFRYTTVDSVTYELCADFQADAHDRPAPEGSEFWRHGIGRKCFRFEIPARSR
jgi:hypothetical protein